MPCVSVFDPALPLRKERTVRTVPRNQGISLAAVIADFCNKICQYLLSALTNLQRRGDQPRLNSRRALVLTLMLRRRSGFRPRNGSPCQAVRPELGRKISPRHNGPVS